MDRQTLANYGWIVVVALILAVMLALATPFGKYVMDGVSSIASGYINASNNAMSDANQDKLVAEWEDKWADSITQNTKPGATFTDGVSLTWEELKDASNGEKYGYDASCITDSTIYEEAFSKCNTIKRITLPEGITDIEEHAFFRCESIESIVLPNSLTTIIAYTFDECDSLKSITVPKGVQTIEDNAFATCESLTIINVDSQNPSYCSKNGIVYSKDMKTIVRYPEGKTETSFTIPASVTSIANSAFAYCDNLKEIIMPNNLTSIGSVAFVYCASLERITLPNTLTSIGYAAFMGCTEMESINFNGTKAQWNAITKTSLGTDIIATFVQCSNGTVDI